MDKRHMIKTILNLTVDIIYLLTGEEYCVIKQRSGERLFPSCSAHVLFGWNRTQSTTQDKNNEQEILELANKIIHLLTGEGEDLIDIKVEVTEKEELFGNDSPNCKEEEIPISILTDGYIRCPSHLHAEDPSEQSNNVAQDGEDDYRINVNSRNEDKRDNYQKIDQRWKEEDISADSNTADDYSCRNNSHEESQLFISKNGLEYNLQDSPNETVATQNIHFTPSEVTLQQDHPGEEKPFSCPECGRGFTKKSSLVRHQIIHVGEKPFSCTMCSKSFARKSTLVEHEKTHTCEKPYSCSDCGKCFVRKANLLDHQRIHTGEKLFSCPVCGKCFTNRTILVRHQKSHTGEKPFSCLECGKRFGHKSVLVKHQIVHTGEKPFPCSECGKCFTQKGNLMEHQKIHTGERPFFCSYCGKYFTNKAVLMRHQVTHSKQRPFSCSQCGKCFMHKANLVKHERSHGTETPRYQPKALCL